MSWLRISRSLSVLVLSVIANAQTSTVYEQLDSALHHYDTLHADHIDHSYSTGSTRHRHVKFNTLGRDFHLRLVHNDGIFSSDFGAHVVGKDGLPTQVHLDRHEFYHGYLHGDDQSSVSAHISESGVLTASIVTASEVYHIEPSHLYVREPHPFHMIAYRSSHVKDRLSGSRMDYVTGPALPQVDKLNSNKDKSTFHSLSDLGTEHRENRLKRQTLPGGIAGSSCPMILVADFNVFEGFGRNVRSIMVQLVQLVDSIDKIVYRPTRWIIDTSGGTIGGLGIEIRNITVHVASSDSSDLRTLYNRDVPNADAGDLLSDMRFGDWSTFCLAHLFTDRNFASGLLGLANIASPFAGQTGGICSSAFRDFGFDPAREVIYNTGLTTFNNNGQRMVMSELIRVTGHELGHSWGSHHDPPGDSNCGDRWLMYEFAQDGSQPTHMEFSSCSRTSIGQVLLNKGTCFANPDPCGNFEVDTGEDCDAGPEGDACCDTRCNFVDPTFTCSDVNHACCVNCTTASAGVVCRQAGIISVNCINDTLCNGEDRTCPESTPAPEGMPCIGVNGGGTCQRNVTTNRIECLSVCDARGQEECTCGEPHECVVCCQDRSSPGTCAPVTVADLNNGSLPLSNGAPCSNDRVCVDGQCTDTTQDVIERFFNIIVNLDINAFGIFIRENIIGFVLIFTIPCWCLGSCLVYCYVDDGWRSFMTLLGKEVKEEADAHLWFMDRVQRYKRWMKRRLDEARIPLLSDAVEAETAGDDQTSSKEDLLPVDPVDDSPAPT